MNRRTICAALAVMVVGGVLSACEDADEIEITGPMLEEVVAAVQSLSSEGSRIRLGGSPVGEPLIFVDGVPMSEWQDAMGWSNPEGLSGHADIDQRYIEKIQVIKGSTAVERYGPEAENGVVLITLRDSIRMREGSG